MSHMPTSDQPSGGTSGIVFNVTSATYGARGDGAADDSAAIQRAFDAAHAVGGSVYFPNGTYLVTNTGAVGWAGCIAVKSNTTIIGQSRSGAVLKLADNQPASSRVLICNAGTDVIVQSLTIDGNTSNQGTPEEHMSGLFIGDTTRFTVRDCEFKNCVGDGISIWANNTDTLVENCYVHDNGRSGVSLTGSGQHSVTLRKCQLVDNANQNIDMEAPDGPFYDVTIDDCFIRALVGGDYACALSGQEQNKQVQGIKFVNNTVEGPMVVRWVEDVYFAGNKCSTRTGDLAPVIQIDGLCEGCEFIGNTFTAYQTGDATNVIITGRGSGDAPTNLVFAFNRVYSTLGHYGVVVNAVESAALTGNRIVSGTHTLGDNHGISIRSSFTAETMKRVEVRDNYIENFTKGLTCWGRTDLPTGHIAEFVCTGNDVKGDASVWAFNFDYDAQGAVQSAVIYGNKQHDCYGMVEAWPQCPVLVGGNRGAVGVYSVVGTPLGAITDAIGSTAVRRNGGAGTTLYVKESETVPGTQDATGWVAK